MIVPMSESRELRVVVGRLPVDWEIPIYVISEGDLFVTVKPACYLLNKQRMALDSAMKVQGTKQDEVWRVRADWIQRRSKKPPVGMDAEELLSWGKAKTKRQVKREEQPMSPDKKAFLDAMCEKGSIYKRNDVEIFWNEVCTHMAEWLLVERKPVDFFFLKLHPSPYRANWKSILLSRFRNMGKILCATSEVKREAVMVESGLMEEMVSLDLLSYMEIEGYCRVRVEVEHRPKWWRLVKDAETDKIKKLGRHVYAKQFMDWIKKRLALTAGLYTRWLNEIARPTVTLSESESARDYEFMPNRDEEYLRAKRPPLVTVDPIVPNKLPFTSGHSNARDLLETYAVLPEMQGVQPEDEDLRDAGANI